METCKIAWKNPVTGKTSESPKTFTRAEADELVKELNQKKPDLEHRVVPIESDIALGVHETTPLWLL